MKLLLVPISPDRYKKRDMSIAVDQATDAIRRLYKKIDISRERKRFIIACEQLQDIALQEASDNTISVTGENAHNLIKLLFSEKNFQVPYAGNDKIKETIMLLPNGLKDAVMPDKGLVAIIEPFQDNYFPPNIENDPLKKTTRKQPDYSLCDVDLNMIKENQVLERTHKQIRYAMETGHPLGWVNYEAGGMEAGLARHQVITQALHDYVVLKQKPTAKKKVLVSKKVIDKNQLSKRENSWWYRLLSFAPFVINSLSTPMMTIQVEETRVIEVPIEPVHIMITFCDGSISEGFPLLCLPPFAQPNGLPVIRAALISSRHFELDSEVDLCLLRNSEINRKLDSSIAEQERFAFETVKKFIEDFIKRKGGLELHLYHTGLEAAVIGNYRALVTLLCNSEIRGKLKVIPMLPQGKAYTSLPAWY
jgi:hypothetical protein